ncbi:hypothetical protein DPMN_032216 [Dreissena polymorpha]|uniref:TRPM-like domain-containing protein n=1 Tax=Dreissena polymorpha TaxID=45954 RepID=A0A9D4M3J2_DREPO|nr:hypothetical protein DPMN_032216 [Dreissena polymorpha]
MTTIKKSCCWPPRRIEPARGAYDGKSPTKLGKFDNATSSTPRDASDLKRPKTSQDLEVKLLAMLRANKTDSTILNQGTLWILYHTDQNKGGTEIEEFVSSRIFFNKDNKEKNDPKVVADCNGADPLCELSEVGAFIADTLNDDKLNPFKTHKLHKRVSGEINHNTPRSEDENNEDILHLFLFAILFNRKELAEIAWARCKDHIGAALIASSLLKELSKIAKMAAEFDIAEEISKVSEKYEHKAYEVLTLCYKSNHGKAHDLLIRKLDKPFESTTLLDIAYANNMWNFMSHTCCQTKLNLIWRGKIAIFTQSWKIFLAIFVPLVVFCIKFRGTENKKMSDAPEGINPNTIKVRTEHSNKTTYTVHGCDNEAKRAIGLIKAWKYLYTAPISVFVLNSVTYVVFLGLFAYFVCVDLNENMTITEWAVWGWSFTMLCEEFRQV